jgi:hypothetical protein
MTLVYNFIAALMRIKGAKLLQDERNNFGGNVEGSGNNQARSIANQGTSDFGEAVGTFY